MPRRPKKYHYIYRTTCKVTGKFYVGMHSTDNLDDGYLGSGKILGYSRRKYGDETHVKEIIEFLPSREALKAREKEIVNEELLSDPLNINLKYGGEGGWDYLNSVEKIIARTQTKSAREKRRASQLKSNTYEKMSKASRSPEAMRKSVDTRRKNGTLFTLGMKGKTHSLNTREKMSSSQQGKSNSQFGTCWVSDRSRSIKIKKDHLDEYLKEGFVRGRKKIEDHGPVAERPIALDF